MQLPDLSLFLVAAIFWATYLVLRKFLLSPLGAVLAERERRVEEARTASEKALERQRENAADLDRRLTEARREALAHREAVRAAAAERRQALLDEAKEKARVASMEAQARLDADALAAREQLGAEAQTLAAEIANYALGRKVA
jgi:F0F1-type ATP synthase membrane subunit b/b'